jgi:hypothetical protein
VHGVDAAGLPMRCVGSTLADEISFDHSRRPSARSWHRVSNRPLLSAVRKIFDPQMHGDEWPGGMATFQSTFLFGPNSTGGGPPEAMASPPGPRNCGQAGTPPASLVEAGPDGVAAKTGPAAATTTSTKRSHTSARAVKFENKARRARTPTLKDGKCMSSGSNSVGQSVVEGEFL